MRRDVLGLMQSSASQFGDVSRHLVGPAVVHLINGTEQVKYVLKNYGRFDKQTLATRMMSRVTGNSVLIANGEQWRWQRRLMQPAFANPGRYVETMQKCAMRAETEWLSVADAGREIDAASYMMQVTYAIAERTLFRRDADAPPELEAAIVNVMHHTNKRIEQGFVLPEFVPSPGNRRYKKAIREVDALARAIIADMREQDERPDCVLADLMATEMNEDELRDQVVTLLIAGHETTANALTWMWHVLATHPEVQGRLHAELDSVLNGREPSVEDLGRLEYCTAVLKETMRLYPPVWVCARQVQEDDVINGFDVPADTQVVVSPYVIQRDPRYWERPDAFEPERFLGERGKAIPPYAYIPFGGGPRVCIGQRFAMQEAVIIAATMARNLRVLDVPEHPVEPEPGITLRAKHGIRIRLERRDSGQT
jgi:cytochrome P450